MQKAAAIIGLTLCAFALTACQTSGGNNRTVAAASGHWAFSPGTYTPVNLYTSGECNFVVFHDVALDTTGGQAQWSHPDANGTFELTILGGHGIEMKLYGKRMSGATTTVRQEGTTLILDSTIHTVSGPCSKVTALIDALAAQ